MDHAKQCFRSVADILATLLTKCRYLEDLQVSRT